MPTYSIVVPVHNEQEVLGVLFAELDDLGRRLDGACEYVMVDDGSTDASWALLVEQARRDPRCRAIRLSRNFGHQVAVTAGLDHATGDAVVIMDADLQDPPSAVIEMAERWREGFDVVYGLRVDRNEDTRFKRTTATWFYRLLNSMSSVDIPAQVGDFRLIDRVVVDALRQMPEHNRYVRGMFSWLGFRQTSVPYHRPARRAGTTSYSLSKMLRLANDGIIGYSKAPLRIVLATGAIVVGSGAAGAAAGVITSMVAGRRSTLLLPSVKAVAAGAQLVAIGLLGEYVARIFDESLDRPLYVVRAITEVEGAADVAVSGPTGQLHELFAPRRHAVNATANGTHP